MASDRHGRRARHKRHKARRNAIRAYVEAPTDHWGVVMLDDQYSAKHPSRVSPAFYRAILQDGFTMDDQP